MLPDNTPVEPYDVETRSGEMTESESDSVPDTCACDTRGACMGSDRSRLCGKSGEWGKGIKRIRTFLGLAAE